jgi:hypothetical protein
MSLPEGVGSTRWEVEHQDCARSTPESDSEAAESER